MKATRHKASPPGHDSFRKKGTRPAHPRAPQAIVCTLDTLGIITSWSPAAVEVIGYTAEEIIGRHFSVFYTQEDVTSGKPLSLLNLAVKNGRADDEGWRVRKDGTQFWARSTFTPVHSPSGQLTGFTKVLSDISQLRQSSHELESTLKDYAQLKAAIDEHAIVAITDRQGRLTYVNDRFCQLSKYTREELIGQTHHAVNSRFHSKDFFRDLWNAISRGQVWRGEIKNRAKDGSAYWVYATIVPCPGADGHPQQYISIQADITQRKELEEQLVVARDHALQASQLKSEFLANMSHEIRTPMNGVIGMNSLLLATPLQPNQRQMAEMVKQSAESLMMIINDILDFSKIEAGKFRIEPSETNLTRIVEDTISLLAPRAHAKKIALNYEFVGPFDKFVEADGERVRQVLLNLVANAVKFTDAGEVIVSVWSWEEHAGKRRIRFEVRDTGIGIPADAQHRLFQPFVQAADNPARKFGGTGLGLAISRQLVDLMGGEIGVKSAPQRGSTFWFELLLPTLGPISTSAEIPLPAGLRILVVDDHPTNRRIITDQLTTLGVDVLAVSSGASALKEIDAALLAKKPFDLAIIDAQMPVMDGATLAKTLRKHPTASALRLILFSSICHDPADEASARRYVNSTLKKPATLSQLTSSITYALEHKPTLRPPSQPTPVKSRTSTSSRLADPQNSMNSGLILLVAEDNPTNQMVVRQMLEWIGHRVVTVGNGAEAVERLATTRFDGVLMDCQMPVLDGYAATRQIRTSKSRFAEIPIIGLTAYAGPEDRTRCLQAGMNDYIAKPLRPEELDRALAHCGIKSTGTVTAALTPGQPLVIDWNQIEQLRALPGRDGASSLLANVVKLFAGEAPARIERMQKLFEEEHWKELSQLSHKFAGSANSIGAKALESVALQIEKSINTGELSPVADLLRSLEREWKRLSPELKKLTPSN